MAKFKSSFLLSVVITVGILVGAGIAVSHYIILSQIIFEKAVSEIFYNSYLDNWELIKKEKHVNFSTSSLKIKIVNYLTDNPDNPKRNEFINEYINEFIQGIKLFNTGQYDRATGKFHKIFSSNVDYLSDLALLYYGYCKQMVRTDYPNALKGYLKLEKQAGKKYPELYYNMATVYKNLGNKKKAEEYYKKYSNLKH